jgi:hypothetical protein
MTTCTTAAWKKVDYLRKHRIVMMKMSLVTGDTVVTVNTGLKLIYSWSVSSPAITGKTLDHGTVSGGVITQNVTNPAANEALYFTAIGI